MSEIADLRISQPVLFGATPYRAVRDARELAARLQSPMVSRLRSAYAPTKGDVMNQRVTDRYQQLRESVPDAALVDEGGVIAEEQRQMHEQLPQMQTMGAVGVLAAGLAHDLNNWLSVVLSCTTLALERLSPGDAVRSDLEEARSAAEYAANLTRRLLALGCTEARRPTAVSVNERLTSSEKVLRRLVGKDIRLSLALNGIGNVRVDPVQLDQIFFNLVVNARDAMPRGGQLTVETTNVTLDSIKVEGRLESAPSDYIRLAVTDTGTGMDAVTRARIFEPFFTTKPPDKGTGLGLCTVLGIAQQLGGAVRVTSEVGAGTTVEIFLPREAGTSESCGSSKAAPPDSGELEGLDREALSRVRQTCRSLRHTG